MSKSHLLPRLIAALLLAALLLAMSACGGERKKGEETDGGAASASTSELTAPSDETWEIPAEETGDSAGEIVLPKVGF